MRIDPATFRAELLRVPPNERDAWLDARLALGDLPEDDAALPRGCVPYFPCAVDAVLRAIDRAVIRADDVFVDVGAGVGRVAALVQLLTGAEAIGVEVQPALVRSARALARRLDAGSRLSFVEGDVTEVDVAALARATVFFLYCPFSGDRLEQLLRAIEPLARERSIRVAAVDVPLPPCGWLEAEAVVPPGDLVIHRSVCHADRLAPR